MSITWSEVLELLDGEQDRAGRADGSRRAVELRSAYGLSSSPLAPREASAHRAPQRSGAEGGFTVPEMLIAAFLVASAAGLIATAIYQIFIVSKDGNARLAALGDLENAALWIGRDVSESISFTPGSGAIYGTFNTSDPDLQYRYSYDASSTALVRQVLVSGSPDSTLRISRRIADQADVSFANSGSLMTVSITATSGATSEGTTLKLGMRAK